AEDLLPLLPHVEPGESNPPPNRTVIAQPEVVIRYTCPRCKKALESRARFAGQKLNCPDCNQRLQIPKPAAPPPPPPINRTVLALEEPQPPVAGQPVNVPAPVVPPIPLRPATTPSAEPGRGGHGMKRRSF